MDKDDIIATLNDLIETSRDGEAGFRTCADGVKNVQLKQMFEQAADRCRQAVYELQAKVRGLGGRPRKPRLSLGRATSWLGRHQIDDHRGGRHRRSG